MADMVNAGGVQLWVPTRQFPASLMLRGPGQLGRGGAEGVLIFNASQPGRGIDLVAQFYQDEFGALDWLDDYLRDDGTTYLVRDLQKPPEEEEEEEEFLLKNIVLNAGPDEV